ncbi:MAG TPA: PqqD family protein, partial [Acidimicrobiia bacterium]
MSSMIVDWSGATPRKLGEAWVRREGDQVAVFDPMSGRLLRLNDSAMALWELCDGSTTAAEMAGALSELTGLTADESLREVT